MRWNTACIAMDRPPEELQIIRYLKLPPRSEHWLTWEDASHIRCGDISLGRAEGWLWLWDPSHTRAYHALSRPGKGPDWTLCKLSRRRTVVVFSLVSETALYGFAIYRQGACVRRWLVGDGDLYFDDGEPLEEEYGAFEMEPEAVDDEDILDFVGRLVPIRKFRLEQFRILSD